MQERTEEFARRATEYLKSQLPIKANGKSFDIEGLTFAPPASLNDIDAQLAMKYKKEGSVKGYIKGQIVIKDDRTNEVISKTPGKMNIIPVYCLTDRGTYMVNGTDKVIRSSMRRKPGVYTAFKRNSPDVTTDINFSSSGIVISLILNQADSSFTVAVNKKTPVNGVGFFRTLGFTDQEIVKAMGNDSLSDLVMRGASEVSAEKIYNDLTHMSASGKTTKDIQGEIFEYLSEKGQFGEKNDTLKQTIGVEAPYLNKEIFLAAIKKLFAVVKQEEEADDPDDLRYKTISGDNDLLLEQLKDDFEIMKADVTQKLAGDNLSYTQFGSVRKLGKGIDQFMSGITGDDTTSLVVPASEINPVAVISEGREISQRGGKGGIKNLENIIDQRNLKKMSFNRLDPIETPESNMVGILERYTQNSKIEDNTIKSKMYKVVGGEAKVSDKNAVYLTPTDEYNSKVAYFDSKYVDRQGDKITFKGNVVPGRFHGKDVMLNVSDIGYIDSDAQNVFSLSANLIPFVHHDDGNRALMGSNMQRQAMDLKYKEAPLVQASYNGTGTTYDQYVGEKYGKPVRSDVNGTVADITDSKIIVKDEKGKKHEYSYYKYFSTTEGSSINNELKVKKGDVVKSGDMLADGWETKDGVLATGVNARIGYLSYKGYNYEDGMVISKSFANKLTSDVVSNEEVEIREDYLGGVGSKIKKELTKYTTQSSVLEKLDEDGIAKVGTQIKAGDTLVAMLRKNTKDLGINAIFGDSAATYTYVPYVIPETSYADGKIERVYKVDNPSPGIKQKICFTIVTTRAMKLGDKVAGKHGNKGTITKILDDDEMPVAEDGKRLDILYSPLGVPSRKNIGQLYEAGAGLIAEKTGKTFIVNNFDSSEKDRVLKGLKEIGVPDGKMYVTLKERQKDGSIKDVVTENPVTVGTTYIMRLNKDVDDKIQARSNYEGAKPSDATYMPGKKVGNPAGEKHNPQSIGEMEFRSLQSHGAAYNILESATIKADGGGDIKKRFAIFSALRSGDTSELDVPATPESLKYTQNLLKGLGLNLNPINNGKKAKSLDEMYDSLSLVPMKDSEFVKMVGKDKEVTKATPLVAKDDGTNAPEKGGLLDPEIFGEDGTVDARNKWGYIKLATPLPNPLLVKENNPYAILTGYKPTEIKEIVSGKKVVIVDPDTYQGALVEGKDEKEKRAMYRANMQAAGLKPGDLINPKELDKLASQYGEILWKAGGESIQSMLDSINVDKELKEAKKSLDGATKSSDVDFYYKKYKILNNLKKNNLEASDLMMRYVPVTPAYMRPVMSVGDNVAYSDATKLYGDLIKSNNPAKDIISNGNDIIADVESAESAAKLSGNIYKHLENVFGTNSTPNIDKKTGKPILGIKDKLSGKHGVIRGKLMSKRVDFSGRSVIGVDPSLELNEVALPADMAKYVYKPFIFRELMEKGKVANWAEAESKWANLDPDVRKAMENVVKDRPVIINRQPTLHKQSIMAYKPIIKYTEDGDIVRNMQLNPLTVTGFNADFDGDTMSIHVPITEKAKEEAKKLMRPTENMILGKNGEMTFKIRMEMVMGIYYLTKDFNSPEGDNKDYNSYAALKKDWRDGVIRSNQKVSIDSLHGTTAGYALFILLIPPKYRPVSPAAFDSKKINNIFADMYADCEASNGKDISKAKIAEIMDEVKALGFDASTKSGVSIGVGDLETPEDIDKLYKEELKTKDSVAAGVGVSGILESRLKAGEYFKKDNNALNMIMVSGAKGKPDQYRKIVGTIGSGGDVAGKPIDAIKSSFASGLSPAEYFRLGKDSRKGVFDRSTATAEPGAFTRTVYSAVQDVVVTEEDCKTSDGIMMRNGDSQIVGRTAAERIILKNGEEAVKKNQTITKMIYDKIYQDDSITEIKVRSPLRCKTVGGVCQKCYGTMPGSTKFPELGTAVGAIASQSFGEPFTQGILNTFHSGGNAAFESQGLPRVKKILSLSKDEVTGAVLAPVSGTVTKIEHGMIGTYDTVYINNSPIKIPHIVGSALPVRVEVGDTVTKGDMLTRGSVDDIKNDFFKRNDSVTQTYADPKQFFKLKTQELGSEEARKETQDMLLNTLNYAVGGAVGKDTIDKRHMEVVLGKLTSKVEVTNPGDSKFTRGDTLDKNLVDKWNAENTGILSSKTISITNKADVVGKISEEKYVDSMGGVIVSPGELIDENKYKLLLANNIMRVKASPKPIEYNNVLKTINTIQQEGPNFFSNMGSEKVMSTISDAATYGYIDKLEDPRGRTMAGKLPAIGEAFNVPKNIANKLTTKIKNIFDWK